jgi:hypothetical protein
VADAMGGQLAPNSQKSWDVLVPAAIYDASAQRVQVKARVVTDMANAASGRSPPSAHGTATR